MNTTTRTYKVRKDNLMRIAELSPALVARLRQDGATVTPFFDEPQP